MPYADKNYGHTVTGDLRIIETINYEKIFYKGPKYREPTSIKFPDDNKSILSGIDECVESWSEKKIDRKVLLLDY